MLFHTRFLQTGFLTTTLQAACLSIPGNPPSPVTVPPQTADNSSQNNIIFDFNFVECLCASIMTCYRVSG